MKKLFFLLFAFLLNIQMGLWALDVPSLRGYVNDYGEMISPETESRIELQLRAFEQSDSTQVVILTVPSLEGEVLEEYVIRVAEKWKIGQAKKDNGVIFFAAKNDRVMRIEVGMGLEGVLTDLLAGRILDTIVRPRFKSGDFNAGFIEGTDAIVKACRGEFKADGEKAGRDENNSFTGFSSFIFIFFLFFMGFISRRSRLIGGITGVVFLPVIINIFLFQLSILGILVSAVIGFIIAMVSPGFGSSGTGYGGGGWSSSDSGGGFSDSGFSGGGGDFGGGGASGDW